MGSLRGLKPGAQAAVDDGSSTFLVTDVQAFDTIAFGCCSGHFDRQCDLSNGHASSPMRRSGCMVQRRGADSIRKENA